MLQNSELTVLGQPQHRQQRLWTCLLTLSCRVQDGHKNRPLLAKYYHKPIPNFKNFLSLHIFVLGVAEQKHTLIKCVTTKQGTIDIKKCQNQHTLHSTQGRPGKFAGAGQNLTPGPSWFHLLTLWLGGSGGILPGKILKSYEVPEMAKSWAFWKSG
jgi:hypothetical protein